MIYLPVKLPNFKASCAKPALVDDEFAHFAKMKWRLNTSGYPITSVKRKSVTLHKLILPGRKKGKQIDHVNRDKFDNRKANLRWVTFRQNQWNSKIRADNTSGFKGVHWNKITGTFRAAIRIFGKITYLGSFDSAQEASMAYQKASKKLQGKLVSA